VANIGSARNSASLARLTWASHTFVRLTEATRSRHILHFGVGHNGALKVLRERRVFLNRGCDPGPTQHRVFPRL